MSLIVGSLGKVDFSGKDLGLHNHVLPRYVGVWLVVMYVPWNEGFKFGNRAPYYS